MTVASPRQAAAGSPRANGTTEAADVAIAFAFLLIGLAVTLTMMMDAAPTFEIVATLATPG